MAAGVKICGLSAPEAVAASVDAGAAYLGFNFFPKSPRYVTPAQAADLGTDVPAEVTRVGLVVNGDDTLLDQIVSSGGVDMFQLHGGEAPDRVAAVKARYSLPVMKVIGVADRVDLDRVGDFDGIADMILLDAKPPKDAVLPGGNGLTFDWRVLEEFTCRVPWMLAGGLTPETVAEAIARTGAALVDVASGVESAPGQKDPELINRFLSEAQRSTPM